MSFSKASDVLIGNNPLIYKGNIEGFYRINRYGRKVKSKQK